MENDPDTNVMERIIESRRDGTEPSPIRLRLLETYRDIPIYHIGYETLAVLDRDHEEEEARAVASIPEPRFGLVICLRNLALSPAYTRDAQAEFHARPEMAKLRERIVASARYNSSSLSLMVRSMTAHLYLRQASGFVPDLESAVRAVRRAIDGGRAKPVKEEARPSSP